MMIIIILFIIFDFSETKNSLWLLSLTCRCGNVSTYQVSQDDVTSQLSEEAEQVRKSFSLSPADDVTVECVAFNHMAMSRQIFKSGMFSGKKGFRFLKRFPVSNSGLYCSSGGPETLFTPSLIGAVSTAGVLLLLLLVALYKWKQVYYCSRLQGSHTLRDLLLFSYCVSSFSET